ncbi:MAG TPA: PfkB family carbohydrate kinase [Gammaproteobacteria bacterium]|nr:PfkB family carbohydrate kinase [Gammaproteobacteria bacterium]
MARILAVGIATLDIVNEVDGYPPEDSEVRAVAQHLRRGGNATNTLVALSQLGHRCAWAGMLAEEPDADRIVADLQRHGIDLDACRRVAQGKVPTSYILLNRRNGSRSIVHYRDLPEFDCEDFRAVELDRFDWLHFEGRAVDATRCMLETARRARPSLPLSLEVEKARPGIESLLPLADVLMFSRAYARTVGRDDPQALLDWARMRAPQAELYLAWGKAGAFALGSDGRIRHCAARPPARTIDTIGAGDVFNAGIIDARVRGADMDAALQAAVALAGRKCGLPGLEGLGQTSSAGEAVDTPND